MAVYKIIVLTDIYRRRDILAFGYKNGAIVLQTKIDVRKGIELTVLLIPYFKKKLFRRIWFKWISIRMLIGDKFPILKTFR